MLKLKKLKKDETYPTDKCSASRCKAPPTATYAAGTHWPVDVHLCDKHQADLAKTLEEIEKAGTETPPVSEKPASGLMPGSDTQASLVQEAAEAKDALAMIEAFKIAEQGDYDFANEALGDAKSAWKRLEKQKKEATKLLNDALKTIRGWFKPAQDFYAQAERILKAKIAEAHRRAQEEQDRALREAQEAHQAGDAAAVREAMVQSQASEIEQASNVSIIKTWDFEIVDAGLLPREYLVPNETAIRGVVKSLGDNANIPGVRVFKTDTVVRRGA